MRHETCLNCRAMPPDPSLVLIAVSEGLTVRAHHHHLMVCLACDATWYEDMVIGGLGLPVPSRRDSVLCPCPEDHEPRYQNTVMLLNRPEAECRCGPRELRERRRARRLTSCGDRVSRPIPAKRRKG
jgi:hypothetical protein